MSSLHLFAVHLSLRMKHPCLYFLGYLLLFGTAAFANEPCKECWIDAKTGQPLPPSQTVPIGVYRHELLRLQSTHDVHASDASGRSYFRQGDGPWTDSATGQPLCANQTVPIGVYRHELLRLQSTHDVHASDASGRTFVRIPCPPPTQPSHTAGNLLNSVLPGLSIGVGGGTVGGHDHGEHVPRNEGGGRTFTRNEGGGRTLTREGNKTPSKTSSTSTSHKVTSACKCHPCTCSPCTCH